MELYLIIPARSDFEGPIEQINDGRWRLSEPQNITQPPGYHCISYQWGEDKSLNLFSREGVSSARTRGALEAAIRSNKDSAYQAYWIDAVCIPPSGSARRSTLESMGFVYARAESVIVVLESATLGRITPSLSPEEPLSLSDEDMRVLDRDLWATRVWTYQEIVNASTICFTAYDMEKGSKTFGETFFNSIGYSLEKWRKRNNASALDSHKVFPGLNALEDACADWQTAGYISRSALTCLTGVEGRRYDQNFRASRLYAAMGALTNESS